jgi:endonuclease-3
MASARATPSGLAGGGGAAHEVRMDAQAKPPRARPKRPTARRMPAADVRPFIEALARANPAPQTELDYADPFQLLVAVVLSAQTTDAAVNKVTPALFAAAPTPAAMAALGEAGIGPLIRTIGLWQAKARNVAALARLLVERHGGAVPEDRDALEALPGVGRKTANVVLNVAFGQSTMAVDTHIFRLGNRTGLAPGKTTRAVEEGLVARIPPELLRDAHHWLILHGRYVCKARTPECWRCVAAAWCRYAKKTPAPAPKPAKAPHRPMRPRKAARAAAAARKR